MSQLIQQGPLALFAAVESVLHAGIDPGKGEGKYGIVTNQALHLVCKFGYALTLCYWAA